ncbi:GNAT family N-acetyltransferase [Marisediminicola sp. LYQ134]|uniref:GNAT family N-acetyltransferase n=1 Tax=unclassified Marisediminicola TaxID=2618316 RepID=UPI0039832456
MRIRELVDTDLERITALNNAAVPAVPLTDVDEMRGLVARSDHAFAAVDDESPDLVAGFVIGFEPGRDYASENYVYFDARSRDFTYVDRIVVDAADRGRGVGRALYREVFDRARAADRREVTCEVNVEPPNPSSLAFHAARGFVEVGRQSTKGGTVVVALLAARVGDGASDALPLA